MYFQYFLLIVPLFLSSSDAKDLGFLSHGPTMKTEPSSGISLPANEELFPFYSYSDQSSSKFPLPSSMVDHSESLKRVMSSSWSHGQDLKLARGLFNPKGSRKIQHVYDIAAEYMDEPPSETSIVNSELDQPQLETLETDFIKAVNDTSIAVGKAESLVNEMLLLYEETKKEFEERTKSYLGEKLYDKLNSKLCNMESQYQLSSKELISKKEVLQINANNLLNESAEITEEQYQISLKQRQQILDFIQTLLPRRTSLAQMKKEIVEFLQKYDDSRKSEMQIVKRELELSGQHLDSLANMVLEIEQRCISKLDESRKLADIGVLIGSRISYLSENNLKRWEASMVTYFNKAELKISQISQKIAMLKYWSRNVTSLQSLEKFSSNLTIETEELKKSVLSVKDILAQMQVSYTTYTTYIETGLTDHNKFFNEITIEYNLKDATLKLLSDHFKNINQGIYQSQNALEIETSNTLLSCYVRQRIQSKISSLINERGRMKYLEKDIAQTLSKSNAGRANLRRINDKAYMTRMSGMVDEYIERVKTYITEILAFRDSINTIEKEVRSLIYQDLRNRGLQDDNECSLPVLRSTELVDGPELSNEPVNNTINV